MTGIFNPPSEQEIQENISEYTTDNERINRLDICKTCENFSVQDEFTSCLKCGCSISLLTLFKFETCPIGKW
jgi:uncharacterized paraquat-inducible protein A